MKLRKAMAVALAGALVLTTAVTGTTSEAAKKTKLKTKKVSIFVKGKKKISITGKKAKHKYTFTSKKKKIAKVSKTGVITGVKAGKTTITVKDTWKQKGKKKTKKLGTVKVTVKKKTPVTTKAPAVTQAPAVPGPSQAPAVNPPAGGGDQPGVSTPPDNPATPAPTPKVTKVPKTAAPTEEPTPTPPSPSDQPETTYAPANMAEVEKIDGVTYDAATGSITVKNVEQFGIPLGYKVPNGHTVWVKMKGRMNGSLGFRSWLVHSVDEKTTSSTQWNELAEPGDKAPGDFEVKFQLVSESDESSALLIKGPVYGKNIDDLTITSIEISYPLGSGQPPETSSKPSTSSEPGGPEKPTAEITMDNISEGNSTTATVSVNEGTIKDVIWSVENTEIATAEKDKTDCKKAKITGVKAGTTEVTAKVTVTTAEGKDVEVTAKKTLTVAGPDQIVVNVQIESAPTEIEVGEKRTFNAKVNVDTESIEEVIWTIEGEAATIETNSLEAAVTGVKAGKVTVTVTVKVKEGKKTGEGTASKTIGVKWPLSYNLDLSKFDSKGQELVVNENGSITIKHKASYQGTGIDVPEGISMVEISVASSKDGTELSGGNQIQLYDTDGNRIAEAYQKGVVTLAVPGGKKLGRIVANAQEGSASAAQEMTIDYIKVYTYKSVSLDLSKFDAIGGTLEKNADGSIKVTYSQNYSGGNIAIGEVKGTIKYVYLGGLPQQQKQVTVMDSAGKPIGESLYWGENLLIPIEAGKIPAKVVVNAQDITKVPDITIGNITVYVEE